MNELQISPKNECHLNLKERLEKMSLVRKVTESTKTKIPLLKERSEIYEGCKDIDSFLTKFDSFIANGTNADVINMINSNDNK